MGALLTIEGAAAELDCSKDTVRRWIGSGQLAAVRNGPKFVRIRREDLDGFVRSHLDYGKVAAELERAAEAL